MLVVQRLAIHGPKLSSLDDAPEKQLALLLVSCDLTALGGGHNEEKAYLKFESVGENRHLNADPTLHYPAFHHARVLVCRRAI